MNIIAGNFKSNLDRTSTINYLQTLDKNLESQANSCFSKNIANDAKVFIFPAISSLVNNNYTNIEIGAQNCNPSINGAFTGEISLSHLNEFNIKTILIGHSERRNIFGESDEVCAKKFEFFKSHNFDIFYCIGEDIETLKNGNTIEFLKKQILNIDVKYENLIIAYEPIWAIGSGLNASLEQISKIMDYLKTFCDAPIIYGGSVNANNSSDILDVCDGILVGSASLDVDNFYKIIKEQK